MARISNKEQAIAYATEHGIILTVEDRVNFDGDYAICERCELPEPRCECPDEDGSELDVWVCECCALMVRNGDESGCRDYYGHTHPTCDKSVIYADMEHTFEVGYFHTNCNGCGELVRTGDTLYAAIRLANN